MIDGIDGRRWWAANGFYVALFFALMIYQLGHDRDGASALALSISGIFSLATVFRFAEKRSAPALWWSRHIVRWLSSWVGRFLLSICASSFLSGALVSLFGGTYIYVYVVVALVLPSLLMIKRIANDFHSARRDFGSISEAGKAMRATEPILTWRG